MRPMNYFPSFFSQPPPPPFMFYTYARRSPSPPSPPPSSPSPSPDFHLIFDNALGTYPPAPSLNFQLIFDNALNTYKKHTKLDLLTHPLAAQLQTCESPSAILAAIYQVQEFHQSQRADKRLTKWLNPTVDAIYAFSVILGQGVVDLVCLRT